MEDTVDKLISEPRQWDEEFIRSHFLAIDADLIYGISLEDKGD